MSKLGFQIVDFTTAEGYVGDGTAQEIAGIYNKIKEAKGKPLFIQNVVYAYTEDEEQHKIVVPSQISNATLDEDVFYIPAIVTYQGAVEFITIWVEPEDTVYAAKVTH